MSLFFEHHLNEIGLANLPESIEFYFRISWVKAEVTHFVAIRRFTQSHKTGWNCHHYHLVAFYRT
jgi:hypothetical protein